MSMNYPSMRIVLNFSLQCFTVFKVQSCTYFEQQGLVEHI